MGKRQATRWLTWVLLVAMTVSVWLSSAAAANPPAPMRSGPGDTAVVTLPNGYRISYLGVTYHSNGTSSWRYRVEELPSAQDLSNWVLEVPFCKIVGAAPEPWEAVHPDPNARLYGIKWQTGAGFTQGEFVVTLTEPTTVGTVQVAAKGPDVAWGELTGPVGAGCVGVPRTFEAITTPPQVSVVGGERFVTTELSIKNHGLDARRVTLRLDLGELLLLDNVTWLANTGYVMELQGRHVVLGLGYHNRVARNEAIRLKLRFKARSGGNTRVQMALTYEDDRGPQEQRFTDMAVALP